MVLGLFIVAEYGKKHDVGLTITLPHSSLLSLCSRSGMSVYHRASGMILGAKTYLDIGHKVDTSIILWVYSRGRILAKTVKVMKDDSSRAIVGPIHEDLSWSMSGIGAKGRIDLF